MTGFEEVFIENEKFVYNFLYKICQNKDLAEELTQETMYKGFLHIKEFSGRSKISTWLCCIAKNEYLQYLRKNRKFTSIIRGENISTLSQDDILNKLLKEEEVKRILEVLFKLDQPYQDIFIEKNLMSLDYSEISKLHSKSEAWCRVTYYRARMKIIERINK